MGIHQYPDVRDKYIICTSTTRPTATFKGLLIYETDTDRVLAWSGVGWTPPGHQGVPVDNVLVNGGANVATTGWAAGLDSTIAIATTAPTPYEGAGYLRVRRSAGTGRAYATQTFAVAPGDAVVASARMNAEILIAAGETYDITLNFLDASAASVQYVTHTESAVGGWQLVEKTFPIPHAWTNVATVQVQFAFSSANTTSGVGIDDATFGYLPMLELPYLVTGEGPGSVRGMVTPDFIGFQRGSTALPLGIQAVPASPSVPGGLSVGGMPVPTVYCHGSRSGAQAIPTGGTYVVWDVANGDTHGMLDTSTGIYTLPMGGIYTVSWLIRYAAAAAGSYRQGQCLFGANAYALQKIGNPGTTAGAVLLSSSVTMRRNAGDTVRIHAAHDTGANLNLESTHAYMIIALVAV
jgi:hypothetical protein